MAKLALIVVDMQVDNEGMCREMDIVEKVVSVIGTCHEKGVPVFISQHHDTDPDSFMCKRWQQQMLKGSEEWKLISDIEAAVDHKKDTFIHKSGYDAFNGTDLKELLLNLGVDTVVVCGTMTNLCCETTARVAFVNNFNVIFLSDGNATSTREFHEATIKTLQFGFAAIKTCDEFVKSLE